jgi:hypothetical protein
LCNGCAENSVCARREAITANLTANISELRQMRAHPVVGKTFRDRSRNEPSACYQTPRKKNETPPLFFEAPGASLQSDAYPPPAVVDSGEWFLLSGPAVSSPRTRSSVRCVDIGAWAA